METIKDLKEEISASIQTLIDMDLDTIRVYIDSDDDFEPDKLCTALERAEENLELIKERADDLADLLSTQDEMEKVKEDD